MLRLVFNFIREISFNIFIGLLAVKIHSAAANFRVKFGRFLFKVSVAVRPIAFGKERAIFGSSFHFFNIGFFHHYLVGVIIVIMWLFF